MLIINSSYQDTLTRELLVEALKTCFPDTEQAPVFICIGSDRHILDCLGPLCGTMLQASLPNMLIYGSLDHPIHARNLIKEMQIIRQRHPGRLELAIDASVGDEAEIGSLQLRQGALLPGKALAKNLPAVGDFSLTGVVDKRSLGRSSSRESTRGLAHVYHMAQVIQAAVEDWYRLRFEYN